ncbi:hypothetical protein [Micromonospora sp. NBC_00617]|uniref:hypothetical protein n=1 Tax=Micromonospora sp. NBC_00617 TaxID=2903587 RepID=UPI00386735F4
MRAQLVCDAVTLAHRRGLADPKAIFHSDRLAQYRAIRYSQRLAEAGAVASVGSKGDSERGSGRGWRRPRRPARGSCAGMPPAAGRSPHPARGCGR